MRTLDLFAGPGGWDLAAQDLGLDPLGVEWDDAACATRHAAGLRTLQADVAELLPRDHGPIDLLIASPPCQAFSMAGKGAGRRALAALTDGITAIAHAEQVDTASIDAACDDPRAHLVLEPLRWALALRPRAIALEQVRPVLPLWEAMAVALRLHGYNVWTGVLSSERYGVPQTRERAILTAHQHRPVSEPPATHRRYIAPRRRKEASLGLFDAPDPERIELREEAHLEPWVSMAEALGWPDGMALDHHRGAGMTERYGDRPDRTTSQPAPVVTAGTERCGPRWTLRMGNQRNATERGVDEPAPAVLFGHRINDVRWLVDPSNTKGGARPGGLARSADEPSATVTSRADQREWTHYDSRQQRDSRGDTPAPARRRAIDEPAPTIAGESRNDSWTRDRPATTVAGDSHVHPPGHKENADDEPGRYEQRRGENAIRVTPDEAAILQSFPPGYPWQGTKTKMFEQIGNAIPPLMARAILATLID